MKDFKEKWQDKKYQAKVKLSGYGIFILIVILMILFGTNSSNNLDNSKLIVSLPNKEIYTINISYELDNNLNEIKYTYSNDLIIKQINNIKYNYKFLDNKYYAEKEKNYILTDISKVYDYIPYDYLDNTNINNYLKLAKNINNKYIINLKDIILDSNSNSNIEITINNNIVTIDYTNLLSLIDNKNYTSYIVTIQYLE